MKTYTQKEIKDFLERLNSKLYGLHGRYEKYYWDSYMGDPSVDNKMKEALMKRDSFSANAKNLEKVQEMILSANESNKTRLQYWEKYFQVNQVPKSLLELREKISDLENKVAEIKNNRKEGYIHPKTKKFVKAPMNQMYMIRATHKDEQVRKAVHRAIESYATDVVDELISLVEMRNKFAKELGYEDFYAYKLDVEEGMTKKELFTLFDDIYDKTKHGFGSVRKMEKKMPGLTKPWNYGYMLAGDFTKEEDQYYPLDMALERWGLSFTRCGIDYAGGELKLDLLERKGKYNNGFCHWPKIVRYVDGKRMPAEARLTTNATYGQVGSGALAGEVLFHEGGHAAHLLNSTMKDVCLNHEYPPTSTAWAETQSMFLDTMYSSIEWKRKYAKNKKGESYPFELFEKKLEKLSPLAPLGMMGIASMMYFEKDLYEAKKLSKKLVLEFARKSTRKHTAYSEDSLRVLNTPHIYSFQSACSYQGYGLAEIALTQWRKYFYDKYGQIVDNPQVGKEMKIVWKLASSKTFPELIKMATGKKLSSKAYLESVLMSKEKALRLSKKRIKKLEENKNRKNKINLKAKISLLHGKKKITDNKKSFEEMSNKYAKWLETQKIT